MNMITSMLLHVTLFSRFILKDIDIGENDAKEENSKNSVKSLWRKPSIKTANALFQGKSKVQNEGLSPEDDNTIFVKRNENTPSQETENENLNTIPNDLIDDNSSEIHSSSKPDGKTFVESFRHRKW